MFSSQAPDMDDVKESVRHGVTKVAGRLSGMASGVMSSIQVSQHHQIWGNMKIYPNYFRTNMDTDLDLPPIFLVARIY